MKIEDEIKQKSFSSEYLKANINLIYTANWANLKITHVLKPFGITPQQFNILRILKGRACQPASIKELTERMLDKSSNASRLVDKLLIKGLVKKETCGDDNRRTDVILTEEGLEVVNNASVAVENEISIMFASLTMEEAVLLNQLLDKTRD